MAQSTTPKKMKLEIKGEATSPIPSNGDDEPASSGGLEISEILKHKSPKRVKDEKSDAGVTPAQDSKMASDNRLAKLDDRSRACPYLDTINRTMLDFDFEKLCSVSLSKINIYACLVCGKYYQGRGIGTHAYTHSVAVDHHVFLNLSTLKFFCLPDNYEIYDPSLADILYLLRPTYTKEQIRTFGTLAMGDHVIRALDGKTYRPGIVGLNNIKHNDYCNVILQALSHVRSVRVYFLNEENYTKINRPPGDQLVLLSQRFGELIRKLWNPAAFKGHVSPHEMLQAVVLCSKKRFQITHQGDPIDFLSWLLNSLHIALNGTKKTTSSIFYKTFRGLMKVYTRKIPPVEQQKQLADEDLAESDYYKETVEELPFLYLTLDLPPPPLFKDEIQLENIIPQIPLSMPMDKFNGVTEKEISTPKGDSLIKRYQLINLPSCLILYIKRFTKNTFFVEKNPTIVNFPISDVDFSEYLAKDGDSTMDQDGANHQQSTDTPPIYDLIANVVHDGRPESGTYRIHILHQATGKWFELQDLHVTEILPQMIPLSEAYIQIWQRKQGAKRV